jgi:nucleoside-diphosphate-sugar epimerase/2-polyprenyl-3-methyl-5-hydroxy-6-metoxy-1,4-benzoquinol methylase
MESIARFTESVTHVLAVSISKQSDSIAIIGATGYIGSRLFDFLSDSGFSVSGFDRDQDSPKITWHSKNIQLMSAEDIPSAYLRSFRAVIYLGGLTGRAVCDAFPEDVYVENVQDIIRLGLKMRKSQLLIFASTSAIAEGAGSDPVAEEWSVKTDKLDNYSSSMFQREEQLRSLSESRTFPTVVGLRFGTVIGSSVSQRQEMAYMAFVRSAFTSGTLDVIHGETSRSWLSMEDLISSIRRIIEFQAQIPKFQLYHLSSFHSTVYQAAAEVAALTGARISVKPHDGKDAIGFSIDATKFSKTFDFDYRGSSRQVVEQLVLNADQVVIGREKRASPRQKVNSSTDICKNVCGTKDSRDIMTVLDLGDQPLANDFRDTALDSSQAPTSQLHVIRCRSCHHVQLSNVVNRSALFTKYLYRSGTTKTLQEHFRKLALRIDHEIQGENKRVLEIACNDGSQLNQFATLGWETYGVDPAENIVKLAQKQGHNVKVGFWGVDDFSAFLPTDLNAIVAQNVFAHVPDPVKFLKDCILHMTTSTKLYIQTSQCDMFETGQFDTIYHEHIHFFTAHSFQRAAELAGLRIINFDVVSIHGRSCLVTMQKRSNSRELPSYSMLQRLSYERDIGITTDFYYAKFQNRALSVQRWVHNQLNSHAKEGFHVIGYGAAAKGIVLLHTLLKQSRPEYKFEYIIDDEPLKQFKYCPGTSIAVRSSASVLETLRSKGKVIVVIFAWNFAREIQQHLKINAGSTNTTIKLLLPFPTQKILTFDAKTSAYIDDTKYRYRPRSWPLPFHIGRRPVVLYAYILSDAKILPYWILHHAHMFDAAHIIDMSSTASSGSTLKKRAPSSWTIHKTSKMSTLSAFAKLEKFESHCDNCWSIFLRPHEFFIHEDIRASLGEIDIKTDVPHQYNIPKVRMKRYHGVEILEDVSLITQISTYDSSFHGETVLAPTTGCGLRCLNTTADAKETLQNAVVLDYDHVFQYLGVPGDESPVNESQEYEKVPRPYDLFSKLGCADPTRTENRIHLSCELKDHLIETYG